MLSFQKCGDATAKTRYPNIAANALELNDSLIPKAYFTIELSSLKTTFPCTLYRHSIAFFESEFF